MREIYNKYGAIIVVSLLFYLGYTIVRPFILPIITAAVVAYVFYPLYKWILSKTRKRNISAFLMCILIFLIVVIPVLYILKSLIDEIPSAYTFITSAIDSSAGISTFIENIRLSWGANISPDAILSSLTSTLVSYIKEILSTLPEKIINLSVSAFFLFFFFRDGHDLVDKIIFYLPFNKKDTVILFRQLKETADAVIFGQVITALAQAFLATMAYFVLGVNAPLFFGIITFIFAIIPLFGPWIVYMPLSLSIIFSSLAMHDSFGTIRGFFLLGYGLGIVSTIDNILKPFLISDKVRIHPGLILIGVLGGMAAFGIIGVLLGPLIIAILITLFNIYEMKERIVDNIERTKKQ